MSNIKTLLTSCSKLELKMICKEMNCSSKGTKNDIISRLLLPLNFKFNMAKKSNFQTQCDIVRDEIFRKSGFFLEDFEDSDDDSDDDDYNEFDNRQVNILNEHQQQEMLTNYLNSIQNTDPNNKQTIMYVLYLGDFGPRSNPKNKTDNVGKLYNCLYNQIINFMISLENQNKLDPRNKTVLSLVYVQVIVPPGDDCARIPLEILNIPIVSEYLRVGLPKNQDEYKLEQLYLLNTLIDRGIKPNIINTQTKTPVISKNIIDDGSQFVIELNNNDVINFKKPTIPISECSFLPVIKTIMETILNVVDKSKVLLINGFWYDTTAVPQFGKYIIKDCQKILGNGLLGSILYFYPLIQLLKQNYGDRFAVTSQYGDKLLERMGINAGCKDLTPFLLKQISRLTTNGSQYANLE